MSALPTTDQPGKLPFFTAFQWWLFGVAGVITLPTLGWPIGDLIWDSGFTIPKGWLILFFACLAAWVAAVNRIGHEKLMRDDRVIIANQESINGYLESLAEGIDTYGDAREAQGHRTASTIRAASNGHGRPLHVVDID